MATLDAERLRHLLDYNQSTGVFMWRHRGPGRNINKPAGYLNENYWRIKIDGVSYLAHRLAYLYVNGEWPPNQIDHENRVKHENNWNNLRPASNSENQINQDIDLNNTSGYKGVSFYNRTGKWRAYLKVYYEFIHLGYFDSKEDAIEVRRVAAEKHYGKFAEE